MAKSCKDLPVECWELILDKLHRHHHSLLESPSLSCKRFLSITNTLRTHLSIVNPTPLFLATLFHRFPNLHAIKPRGVRDRDLDRVIIDIATSSLNLKTLDVTGAHRLPLESFKILGSRMKNLRVLKCSFLCTLSDVDLDVIADSMPCLEDLDISYPQEFCICNGSVKFLHMLPRSVRDR